MNDEELNRLLREWKAPDAPPHLRPRPAQGSRQMSWLAWLVTGRIRVPVPALAALVLVAAGTASTWATADRPAPAPAPETSAPRPSGERARYKLTGPLEGFDAVLVELNFRPGRSSPEHRHPGFILGYVVDGQVRTAINHEADQIVVAGGTFFEPFGALHTAFGSASKDAPARAVAFMVVPTGSPAAIPK
jgi:quercetin dioxygenase-like cupin family protein